MLLIHYDYDFLSQNTAHTVVVDDETLLLPRSSSSLLHTEKNFIVRNVIDSHTFRPSIMMMISSHCTKYHRLLPILCAKEKLIEVFCRAMERRRYHVAWLASKRGENSINNSVVVIRLCANSWKSSLRERENGFASREEESRIIKILQKPAEHKTSSTEESSTFN